MTDIEKAIQASWSLGRLYVHLNPSQKKMDDRYMAVRDKHSKFVINCSRKLGKSVFGFYKANEIALQKPNALIAFIAPTVDSVQNYIKQLAQVVYSCKCGHSHEGSLCVSTGCKCEVYTGCPAVLMPKIKKTELIFANGSKILFRGVGKGVADSYHNLRSFAFDLIILDEAAFSSNLDEIVDGALLATLLPRKGNMLLLSTPPITPDHAFKDYCEQAKLDGAYMEITLRESHYSLAVQDQFIKELGGLDSAKVQREFFCKFIIDADFQIVPEWNDKYIEDVPRDSNWKYFHKYLSLDPGWTDFSICLFGYYNWSTKKLILLGEVMMKSPHQTTDLLAAAIIAKEKEIFGDLPIEKRIADNNQPSLLTDFTLRHKLYFYPVESKARLDVMVSDVREIVKDDRLRVSPACIQLIGCLRNGVFTKTKSGNRGKEFARSKTFGHYDAMAALIYLVRELDQTKNPLPALADKNIENTFVSRKLQDEIKGPVGEIVGAGMDDAMTQTFNYQEHEDSYD